jgi:hypothetical protein
VTPLGARARGQTVYTISSSGRAYGVDPEIHGVEITVGAFVSEATVTANGTDTLTVTAIPQDSTGSRFEATMPVTLTGTGLSIPGGTTILSVSGRPGDPATITLSNTVTGSGSGTLTAQPAGTIDVIGMLVTGNWGTGSATSVGTGLQFQAQNAASAFRYGVNFGASSLLSTGIGFRFASLTAARAFSVESATLEEGVAFAGGTYSNAGIYFTNPTMNYGIRFLSTGTYSTAAIMLDGQHIQFGERSADPSAPAANGVRFYAKDNGAGKTQLVARFATGAVQVIATEP